MLGLTNEYPTMPKPELILEIDEDECCEVVNEEGTDVEPEVLDVTEDDDHEEGLVDDSGDGESD